MSRRAAVILALSCFWSAGCQLVVQSMPAGMTEMPVTAAARTVDHPDDLTARGAAGVAPSAQPPEVSDVPATAAEISRLDLATALSLASGRSAEAAFAKARVEEA
ncbi:MAG: hypothetical protein ACOVRM_16670, partial [Planctomycetaceae bacterium]